VVEAEGVVACGASPKGRSRGDPPPAARASSPPATSSSATGSWAAALPLRGDAPSPPV